MPSSSPTPESLSARSSSSRNCRAPGGGTVRGARAAVAAVAAERPPAVTVVIALVFVPARDRLAPGVNAWLPALLVASVACARRTRSTRSAEGKPDFRAIALRRGGRRELQLGDGGAGVAAVGDAAGVRGDLRGVGRRLPPFRIGGVPPTGAAPVGAAPPAELEARAATTRASSASPPCWKRSAAARSNAVAQLFADPAHAGLFSSPMRWRPASRRWFRACSARNCRR